MNTWVDHHVNMSKRGGTSEVNGFISVSCHLCVNIAANLIIGCKEYLHGSITLDAWKPLIINWYWTVFGVNSIIYIPLNIFVSVCLYWNLHAYLWWTCNGHFSNILFHVLKCKICVNENKKCGFINCSVSLERKRLN